jgi:hypothetical protein
MKITDIEKEKYIIYVGLLTKEQKELLINQLYTNDSYFNPIQDNSDNWVISVEEMEYCDNPEFLWIKDLELILYVPKELINPFI